MGEGMTAVIEMGSGRVAGSPKKDGQKKDGQKKMGKLNMGKLNMGKK